VLRLDARGAQPGRDGAGFERHQPRIPGEPLKHLAASWRASCGRPAA
jgi:hypothetical protein